ncbi:MAG: carbohydrate ABC transporter permease [Actinomycetota bacterium]|jgi:multiple sugar transport system permease protein|nr:carbohydrate ABC transporter permease [Actinomycetota bacterium]MDQ4084130.1 carbohydrate ABC transporter permease [Actinomycetota bacterium]
MTQITARAEPKANRLKGGQLIRLFLSYGVLILLTAVFVAPLLWMLSTSLKPNVETTRFPPTWIPEEFSGEGYSTILTTSTQTPVLLWFVNSVVAATAYMALVLITASLAAYALARMNFRGKNIFFAAIIATLFIPPITFFTPNYLIVDTFGWLDTLWSVIVPPAAGGLGVFFLRQFFISLPRELEEAALIDGANRLQIFLRVILPLSKAPLATLALLMFLINWNEFLWPVYILFTPESQTLPPGLATLQGAYTTNYTVIMAGGVIASIPVLIVYIIAQRYIIEGIARSGIKG